MSTRRYGSWIAPPRPSDTFGAARHDGGQTGLLTFEGYVRTQRRAGHETLQRYACPMLVHLGSAPPGDTVRVFRTELAEPGPIRPVAEVPTPVPLSGALFPVSKRIGGTFADRIGVGRAPNVDVHVPFPRLSKYHAYFVVSDDGTVSLADAGSRNGTWVDGDVLSPRRPRALRARAEVRFGPYRFAFLDAGEFASAVRAGRIIG